MELPPEWQTPEAQQALADAMQRAIDRWLSEGGQRGAGNRIPSSFAFENPHGLPHGRDLERVARLALQGDKLALAEVRASLARARAQHEPVARGIDCKPQPSQGRPPQVRTVEFVARFVLDEMAAGATYAQAVARAGEVFCTAYTSRAGPSAPALRPLTRKRLERMVRDLLQRGPA